MLLPKTFLSLHNTGLSITKDTSRVERYLLKKPTFNRAYSGFTRWLIRGIGEPPVLVDSQKILNDHLNLKKAYFAHGYFYPEISYEINYPPKKPQKNPKATVVYTIKENKPFKIKEVHTVISDSAIMVLWKDSQNVSLLRPGDLYNHKNFAQERIRIADFMRNHGYFSFSPSMVSFTVDTLSVKQDSLNGYGWFDLTINIAEEHQPFRVRNIKVRISSPDQSQSLPPLVFRGDSVEASFLQETFINPGRIAQHPSVLFMVDRGAASQLNYDFIASCIYLREDSLYSKTAAYKTQQSFQKYGMFQYAVLQYEIVDSALGLLDITIDTRLADKYQLKVGADAFTNDITSFTSYPGIGARLFFRDRNAFRRAEVEELSLGGNLGFYTLEGENTRLYYELLARNTLQFPRLLLPTRYRNRNNLQPSTQFTTEFRRQNRVEYDKTFLGLDLNYQWLHRPNDPKNIHRFTPWSLNYVDVSRVDDEFLLNLVFTLLSQGLSLNDILRDYTSRINSRTAYSFIHSNYMTHRVRPTYFLRAQSELGGNLPYLVDFISYTAKQDSNYTDNLLWNNVEYGQYLKASLEAKYYIPVGKTGALVFRGLVGSSLGFNHTKVVPLYSVFYSGGINGMRGWLSNSLGPGKYEITGDVFDFFINNGGETIFEANAEWRFKLYSFVHMALFTDAGNVWYNRLGDSFLDESALLKGKNLALGWDAGVGFRLDFSFLLLRIDLAQRLYDPRPSYRWAPASDLNSIRLNLSIGHPF